MSRTRITLAVVVILIVSGPGQAQQDTLDIMLELTYLSKWMVKGSEGYGQQGAFLKTVSLDFWATGLGMSVAHREATASGYVDKERLEYKLYYSNKLFEDEDYTTKYKIHWVYKHYPNRARDVGNTQEWMLAVSWPQILPGGLVPHYLAYYEYPAGSHYDNSDFTGWFHAFGLGYDWAVPPVLAETTEQLLHLSASIAYRDGLGGRNIDHDWSHATFGVSTELKFADNTCFVPGLYHQLSMDDSVSKRDVTYLVLSTRFNF